MNKKLKVLILHNYIMHYRVPVLNILAQKCDLTFAYCLGEAQEGCDFNLLRLPTISFCNRLYIQKDDIRKLASNYDVVVTYGSITWPKFATLPWFNSQKTVIWSLGVSAGYNKPYDQDKRLDWLRKFIFERADAVVFYSDCPVEKYARLGIDKEKMFVAPNTVEVCPSSTASEEQKDSILFIGTLYRQKGINVLLAAYGQLRHLDCLPKLKIVGKGPDYDYIKSWIEENEMQHLIELCGAVYDPLIKSKYFAEALACISPLQAGLAVLESMGYGVPFVTTKSAITGGELFNIEDGVTGVLMSSVDSLVSVVQDIAENRKKFIDMGIKARTYYLEHRTPECMADGLWKAICYAHQKEK